MENVYKEQAQHKLSNYKSLGELMWITIKSHEDKIAQLDACTEETVTYAELQNKVVRCALWLQKKGIKSGDVISICTGNHLNSIVPCLSTTYINAIFNPWNENMDLQTALYFLQLMMPKMIFCSEKSVNIILSAIKKQNYNATVVVFGKHVDAVSFSDILKNCNDVEVTNFRYIELDNIKKTACIMHSSGTTGIPKGVELSNYAMLFISLQYEINLTNVPSLWFSTIYWITGVIMSFSGIIQSTKAIIYPEFDEEMTCRLIQKYKIETVFLSTNMMNRLHQSNCIQKYPLSFLKTVMFGGTSIRPKVQEELEHLLPHVQILQCYDPETGKVLNPNQSGEIWLKLPSIMNGYYKNPEATKNTIDKDGWIHSGDIGYIDEDGEIFIVDRIKDLIKYRGYQISPTEIENVLISHPAVSEVVVIGIPHAIDDEHPLAFIIKQPGAKVMEQELIDFVANNMMDDCKLRGGVIFLSKFPYTSSGKILKKELKVQVLFLGTNLLNRFLRSEYIQKYPLSSLKVIKCGGSLLKSKVQENLRHVLPHVQILQCYGMTETGGIITIQQPHHKNGSCGVLIENVKIKIVDPESGKVLGSNQSGEVWIKVPSLMNGYYRNPEATKNIIDNEGWLHSGDIGYVDEDGELFIIDRIKELIKYKGYHISPGEIENILLSHPAVLEAAIIGVPHILDDEHPLAYINKRPGVKVTEQELIDFVAKNMEDRCKLRGGVIFLNNFPCTDSGKISKKDLKAMARKLAQQN
ncbi:Luciferin 4-monooxygenase [Acromyrmex echinatior]|uniref:Luciferin 4-monooxygenase n=1 Tax=Acromyrmex echinatior TaxID=103372 RepID=F4WMS5_ACREC|nr:Luciferin 4-monooxygenase [Acromyrmex echinatior]